MELATGVPEYRGSLEGRLLVAHPKSDSEPAQSSLHIASYTAQCLRDCHECCDGRLGGWISRIGCTYVPREHFLGRALRFKYGGSAPIKLM